MYIIELLMAINYIIHSFWVGLTTIYTAYATEANKKVYFPIFVTFPIKCSAPIGCSGMLYSLPR